MFRYVLLLIIFLAPAISMAQSYTSGRAGTWDFSVGGLYQRPDTSTAGGGSSLEVDDAWGLGFNVGYNWTDHFSVNMDFDFLRPDYTAVIVSEPNPPDGTMESTRIDHEISQFNGRLKGTYLFSDGPFVPFIEAGIGWTYVDSNVASGPPQGFCWWHPWWGYVCESFVNTFSSTEFSYGAGLGFRYELVGNSFIKASYNLWVLDTGSSAADPELETFRLEYGWNF
jgi:opacity protein-like surface antigen